MKRDVRHCTFNGQGLHVCDDGTMRVLIGRECYRARWYQRLSRNARAAIWATVPFVVIGVAIAVLRERAVLLGAAIVGLCALFLVWSAFYSLFGGDTFKRPRR